MQPSGYGASLSSTRWVSYANCHSTIRTLVCSYSTTSDSAPGYTLNAQVNLTEAV